VLPEVSTAGKKIDLVCVERPPGSDRLPSRLKPYRLDVWLRPDTPFSRPDWVRRFGIDQAHMWEIEGYLSGNRVWLVELKEHLTAEALGRALVYEHHFSWEYPGMPVRRTLVACRQSDPVIEEVCRHRGVETVVLEDSTPDRE
jgi:hypothetical protein